MTINEFNFAGKKAIVRVDFNVPLDENGKITDDTRIRGALPTLKKILADGGAVIIMSHMGKPKGKVDMKKSLGQIREAVEKALGVPVAFAPDCAKAQAEAAALKMGEALLLENLRFYPEEEGKPVGIDKADPAYDEAKKAMKASQKEFAKTLASYADCYVMDAFGTAHRKHASTAVIADYFDANKLPLSPTTSTLTTRCSVCRWRKRFRLLTPFSLTSSVLSLPSWVVLRYLPKLVLSRTCWARLTSSSSAVV